MDTALTPLPGPATEGAGLRLLEQSLDQALAQVLAMALKHHQCGEIGQAETLYRSILDAAPRHAEANYHLGLLAMQMNQPQGGLPHFAVALDVQPESTAHWVGYAQALIQSDELAAARELLVLGQQQGLDADATALIASQLEARERTARIIERSRRGAAADRLARAAKPAPGARSGAAEKAWANRQIERLADLYTQGRMADVEALARELIGRYPLHGFCWKMLGTVLQAQQRMDEALQALQRAAELWSEDAETHSNLGVVFKALGRIEDAEASYQRALQLAPDFAHAHNNLGILRKSQGRLVEAAVHYGRALDTAPDLFETHSNLGNVLKELGRHAEAEDSYRRALDIAPTYAAGHTNLGVLLLEDGRLTDAEACHRRALQLDPACRGGHTNLASALLAQGRLPDAEVCLREALAAAPRDPGLQSGLLFCLSHGQSATPQALFAEHRRFGEYAEQSLRALWHEHGNSRDPERCLQVGFVSGDLCGHAVASFIEPVLQHLAGVAGLCLHAYSNTAAEDAVTLRLRGHFRHWQRITALSDDELADRIRADGIDILIDLSGHTDKHRLLAFARKPAPVQASWIGYPGTTGLSSIDYYLADRFLLPPGEFDKQFTEQLVYLPANAPFLPLPESPPVNPLPALARGHVTFGSFNRPNKIGRGVVALWSQLLRAVPQARMVLGAMPQELDRRQLANWFAEEGVTAERLSFHPRSAMGDYLALHHEVDFCLDTFPYNGGTTSLHALWMGVPTLTLAGPTMAGRVGAAVLGHVDLPDFVAVDAAAFVRQGVAWTRRLPELARLRSGLRDRFARSAPGQPALIAAGLERALRTMWRRWCGGLPPLSFDACAAAPAPVEPVPAAARSREPIYVTQPHLPPLSEFVPYLQQIWDKKWLTNNGQFHQQFERALSEYLGVDHVALFSNGTLALVTALQALRIGGEVITTPYSFVATAHSLLWNGIKPVFVDVDPVTLNLDPRRIEAAITPQTTAIMPVHVYGHPCDVKAIERVADDYNLRVIYDAAHAFGVQDEGGSVLRHGDLSVLSFHATKVFNTFEGGAIICPDAKTKQRVDHLKNFGFVDEVTVVAPGINGKMSEVNAAFGLLQLRHIDHALARRREIDAAYRERLRGVRGIHCVRDAGEKVANHSYFPVLVEADYPLSRDGLYQKLRDHGIHARRYFYPLISSFPMYRGLPSATAANLPVATEVAGKILCLPIYPALEPAQLDAIVRLVARA